MAHRVVWSHRAVQDLEKSLSTLQRTLLPTPLWLCERSSAAFKYCSGSRAGRRVPEFEDGNIRELLAYSYRVIYRLEAEEVVIAAVVHGKRMLQ